MRRFLSSLFSIAAAPAAAEPGLSALLTEVETLLRQKSPDAAASLRPGLDAAEISALEEAHGLTLPEEVRAIYRWHDGQDPGSFQTLAENMAVLSLSEALEVKEEFDGMIGHDFTLENWWHPAWLPIFHNGGGAYLVVDGAGLHGGPKGQIISFYSDEASRPIIAPGLTAFMEGVRDYYTTTPSEEIDEFRSLKEYLPEPDYTFEASGTATPLQ